MKRVLFIALGLILTTFAALAQKPALTQNIDEKGRTPYQQTFSSNFSDFTCTLGFPPVPAGNRLVILNLNFLYSQLTPPTDTTIHLVGGAMLPAGASNLNFPPELFFPIAANNGYLSLNTSLLYYVEAGHSPVVRLNAGSSGSGTNTSCFATITGYLVAVN